MSATKIGENTTNILKLLFFIINLNFVTSNQLSTDRKLIMPLTSSVYFIFFPLEMQETKTKQSISCVFPLCLKRNDPQTFKSDSCKNPFLQCICYCYNLFRWMFLILCDTWMTMLFIKVNHCSETVLSDMLLLTLYFMLQLRNNNMMLIPKFQNKADCAS